MDKAVRYLCVSTEQESFHDYFLKKNSNTK